MWLQQCARGGGAETSKTKFEVDTGSSNGLRVQGIDCIIRTAYPQTHSFPLSRTRRLSYLHFDPVGTQLTVKGEPVLRGSTQERGGRGARCSCLQYLHHKPSRGRFRDAGGKGVMECYLLQGVRQGYSARWRHVNHTHTDIHDWSYFGACVTIFCPSPPDKEANQHSSAEYSKDTGRQDRSSDRT